MKTKLILLATFFLIFGAVEANAQYSRYHKKYPRGTYVSVVTYPRPVYRHNYHYGHHYKHRPYYNNRYTYRHIPPGHAKKYYGGRSAKYYTHGHNKKVYHRY